MAYSEAADLAKRRRRETVCKGMSGGDEDPLIAKTHRSIGFGDNVCFGVQSLNHTTHLAAVSTALQMAMSHHAIGAEVASAVDDTSPTADEDTSELFKEAAKHHLGAYKMLCDIRSLREASEKASKGKINALGRFKGAAKMIVTANRIGEAGGRLTMHGRNLGLVSFDRSTVEPGLESSC